MISEEFDKRFAAELKEIRQKFFTYRNGIVADTYHKAGAPYKTVFGLQVPQLGQIAREIEGDADFRHALALHLWGEKDVRESRLLACWLFNPELVEKDTAIAFAMTCRTQEEADIFCWRLLRQQRYAGLADRLENINEEGCRRCAAALRR